MRQLILFLVGLFTGAMLALVGMNALRRGTSHAEGLMVVMAAQMKGLGQAVEQNRCGSSDILPRLQALRLLANDVETAFPELSGDRIFLRYASELRRTADAVLAQPPANCPAVAKAASTLKQACQSCHRDYNQ